MTSRIRHQVVETTLCSECTGSMKSVSVVSKGGAAGARGQTSTRENDTTAAARNNIYVPGDRTNSRGLFVASF